MKTESSSPMLTQSVTRALAILSCFTPEQPELRVSDFVQKLDLTQSNVSRLLSTMVALGYVEKDEMTGFYRLGRQIISLAGVSLNNSEIRRQSLPELYELEMKLGLGANLAILDRGKMFYLAHVDSHKEPRMNTLIGYRNPLHCTGIGKVLLAFMPEEKAVKLIDQEGLPSFTHKTISDKQKLMEELDHIRKCGFSTEVEELRLGRCCMAAPVFDRTRHIVAGISISGPLSEFKLIERENDLSQILLDVANRISTKLGYIS